MGMVAMVRKTKIDPHEIYDVREVAEYLGVGASRVRQLRLELNIGRLKGNAIIFTGDEVKKLGETERRPGCGKKSA